MGRPQRPGAERDEHGRADEPEPYPERVDVEQPPMARPVRVLPRRTERAHSSQMGPIWAATVAPSASQDSDSNMSS